MEIKHIDIALLEGNRGQVDGLPANPRKWTQREVERIAASLQETPELKRRYCCDFLLFLRN